MFMMFYAVDSILYFEEPIFLKGRSFQVVELALYELSLLSGQFFHASFEIAVKSIILGHCLLAVYSHLRLQMCEPLHEFKISSFLPLQVSSEQQVLMMKQLVVFAEVLVVFEELEVVFSFYVHSSIIMKLILIEIAA